MRRIIRIRFYIRVILFFGAILLLAKKTGIFSDHETVQMLREKIEQKQEEQTGMVNPVIRVLLMDNGYQNVAHAEASFVCQDGLTITYGDAREQVASGEEIQIAPDDPRFSAGCIYLEANVSDGKIGLSHLKRGYGVPYYRGRLELRPTQEGIVIINEISMEEYLCQVVPSEMPASYEEEALKAQAICARTFTYQRLAEYAYPEYAAHLNDSTDFQVYNNSEGTEATRGAVKDTNGKVLMYDGAYAGTYYYSTSCGRTTDLSAWGGQATKETAYLQSIAVCDETGDYERELPWYRWSAEVSREQLTNQISLYTGTDLGTLTKLEVTKRGPGEIALQLTATGTKGTVTIDTEHKIRRALGGSGYTIVKNDQTTVPSTTLLPSAFFTLEETADGYRIQGGGYGHGVGMSQNGANEMAKKGKTCDDILALFYPGTAIVELE